MDKVPESFVKFITFYFTHYKLSVPQLYRREFFETMFWFTLKGLSEGWGQWWLLQNSDINLDPVHYGFIIMHCDQYNGSEEELSADDLRCYRKSPSGYQKWYDRLKSPGLQDIEKERVLEPFYKNVASHWPNAQDDKGRIHLALWASMFWFASPDAEGWRRSNHEVFTEVYNNESCYIFEWSSDECEPCIIPEEELHFTERTFDTCTICGQKLHCVTRICHESGQHHLCQQCAMDNFGRDYIEDFTGWDCDQVWEVKCEHCMNTNCKFVDSSNMVERMYQAQQNRLLALEHKAV